MKKAADILLIISAIVGFVSVAGLLIAAIAFFVFASPASSEIIRQGIENGSVNVGIQGTVEEKVAFAQGILGVTGGVLLVIALPTIIVSILCLVARKKDTQNWYIAIIVLAIISGQVLMLVAGVLGIVALNSPVRNE